MAIDNSNHRSVGFVGSRFASNTVSGASVGGEVLCVRNAFISLTRCVFSNNSAVAYAGVLKVDDSGLRIRLCSFVDNSAQLDGGVAYIYTYSYTYSIRPNTILLVEMEGYCMWEDPTAV